MQLEFTATACRRPGIFQDSLASFATNLCDVDFLGSTLYLNVDPLGGDSNTEMVIVANRVFGNVVFNLPTQPSFPAAVKWCWQKPAGSHFFHLEDDWLLTEPVHIGDMLGLLDADPALSLVNLRAYPHNDERLCLAPGLWRTSHAKAIAERLRADANPERQLRAKSATNPHGGAHEGFKGRQFPSNRVIKDMGRAWLAANNLKREGGRDFVAWRSLQ